MKNIIYLTLTLLALAVSYHIGRNQGFDQGWDKGYIRGLENPQNLEEVK